MASYRREELKEKYDGKLSQEMEGPLCEIFSRLMRVMVGHKIIVPGSFKKYVENEFFLLISPSSSNNNQYAIACSCKATSGYLYPLDKGFIFVHKPVTFVSLRIYVPSTLPVWPPVVPADHLTLT